MKKETENQIECKDKTIYELPMIQIINFISKDIITTSGGENLGEWDPQEVTLE